MGEVLTYVFLISVSLFFIREVFINTDWLCKLIAGAVGFLGLYETIVSFFS